MKKIYMLLIPLALTSFTHLWNPVGFPDIFFDEGVYMRRALNVITEGSPQEALLYEHPYFGQIILAGFLSSFNFPESLNLTSEPDSLKSLYLFPRLLMGVLAILDTFLIYKIAEKKYGNNVAFIASILFAVMPITWIFRRILLDSLLLPFLLSSILVTLHISDSSHKRSLVILSGLLFGFAVFTKIPTIAFIPFVLWLVFTTRKKFLDLGVWFVPVILIPMSWPLYSMSLGQFDFWMRDFFWQSGRDGVGIALISDFFLRADPILFGLGIAGIIIAIYRRDFFILIWSLPVIAFIEFVGYTQYFHSILLVPVFCIGGAMMILSLLNKYKEKFEKRIVIVSLGFSIFGLASLVPLITSDVSSSQFETMSFVLDFEREKEFTILASPVYSWVFDDVFKKENVPKDYSMVLFEEPPTKDLLLIADSHFLIDIQRGPQLEQVYSKTKTIQKFDSGVSRFDTSLYPFWSITVNFEGKDIDIRIFEENDQQTIGQN